VVEQIRIAKAAERRLKSTEKSRRKQISLLQGIQRVEISKRRALNGAVAVARRTAAAETRTREAEALAAGRFWECSEVTLKEFFSVPFACRKLVNVSQRHRAALFIELEHGTGPDGYGALVPTSRAYLCGIDDNGEQWGFRVSMPGEWSAWEYGSTVEEAMAVCWGVDIEVVQRSYRQGEVLFWASEAPVGLKDWGSCTLAPSHDAESPSLQATGTQMDGRGLLGSADPIVISHPTHAPLTLPAGTYAYAIHGYDAD
jgi:hypothetical protein